MIPTTAAGIRTPILVRFPTPPPRVAHALHLLAIVEAGDRDAIAALGDVTGLPRPWDPATCPDPLRAQLWWWLDQVAAWLNLQYAERPHTMLPTCWPARPHLAAELAVLACLRDAAGHSPAPHLLEEWHRYALPTFLDRAAARFGDAGCRAGHHIDWPGAARHATYLADDSMAARRALFAADTAPAEATPEAQAAREWWT